MDGKQLKNSILQWAIQGKLVPQNPKDEPAQKLLERIAASRNESTLSLPKGAACHPERNAVKSKDLKKKKTAPASRIYRENGVWYEQVGNAEPKDISDDIPFEIPENWAWCRLNSICDYLHRGKSPTYSEKKMYPVMAQKCNQWDRIYTEKCLFADPKTIDRYLPEHFLQLGDVIINSTGGGTVGRTGYVDEYVFADYKKFVADSHVTVVRPNNSVCSKYVYYFLITPLIQIGLEERCAGSTNQIELGTETIKNYLISVPPSAEQKRIVAKLEQVLPLADEYGAAQEQLDKLNKELPETLKKSILQQAIQGKLVPQNHKDEPASILLEKIRKEKQELVKQGKLKKKDLESEPISEDEIPFDIPSNWSWCRLKDVVWHLSDGTHKTPKYTESGIPFISVKNMSSGKLSFENTKFVSKKESDELNQRCNPEKGDLLLSKVGTTGIPVIVDVDIQFSLFVSLALIKFFPNLIDSSFFVYLIKSPLVQTQVKEHTRGVGNKNWVLNDISRTVIALPPLAEQKRIVTKLEQLFKVL